LANHYILDGGSGDGSAWDNALDDLPAAFVRGDTYYVGDVPVQRKNQGWSKNKRVTPGREK